MRLLSHTLLKFGNLSKEIDDLMVRRSFSKQQGQSDPNIVSYYRATRGKYPIVVHINTQSGRWVASEGEKQIMAGKSLDDIHRLTNTFGD